MAEGLDSLIERLAADAKAVRRLHRPLVRAALWLLPVFGAVALFIYLFADWGVLARRAGDEKFLIELFATFATGITSTVAAYELSLPDRSFRWAYLPLAPLLLWVGFSGYSCLQQLLTAGSDGWAIGKSANCFMFILMVSVPLAGSLFVLLRRAEPLSPLPVAAMGGLASAAIAAFALQFIHPFDVTFMDLGVHATAIVIVVLVMTAMGRFSDIYRSSGT